MDVIESNKKEEYSTEIEKKNYEKLFKSKMSS